MSFRETKKMIKFS